VSTTSGLCKVSGKVLKIGTSSSASDIDIEEIVLPDTADFSQFEQGIISLPGENNPITKLSKEYGEEVFDSSVRAVNTYFSRQEVRNLITEEKFPILFKRVSSEIIFTPIEVANFTLSLGYTPTSLTVSTSIVSINLLNQFESFYTQNFTKNTIGSFCAILPSVFGAVGIFFTALQALDAASQALKNFALNFSLSSLLSRLKNGVLSIIDKTVEQVKSTLENFSLANVISQLQSTVVKISEDIYANFQRIKTLCLSFCDEENVKNYKSAIQKLIDYATSIFKNPTIQEVQFLLYRFCSFAALIENSISSLRNPLDAFVNAYTETVSILQSSSSRNTARAINAGAVRYDIRVRQSGINIGQELYQQAGNPPPLTASDYEDITPWNNGRGDSRITFVGNSFSDPRVGRDGWDKVNPTVKTNLMRVQREFGRQLRIVSGYRPREYNDALRARGVGAAKESLHISGLAVDVNWSGFNAQTKRQFIDIALRNGFRGIGGSYSSFVHIDIGPRRSW
jgi:hypothetical protein